jgi:hypothetical protein
MRAIITGIMVSILCLGPAEVWASQKPVASPVEAKAWREVADEIPLGSRVKVQTTDGKRVTATLMRVSDEGLLLKKNTRIVEPAIAVGFDALSRLERDTGGGGVSIGKAIGIGIAAGAGAILTMFAIAFSLGD